jgi:hypothetical protein
VLRELASIFNEPQRARVREAVDGGMVDVLALLLDENF